MWCTCISIDKHQRHVQAWLRDSKNCHDCDRRHIHDESAVANIVLVLNGMPTEFAASNCHKQFFDKMIGSGLEGIDIKMFVRTWRQRWGGYIFLDL